MRSDILKYFSFLFTLTLLSCGGGGGDREGSEALVEVITSPTAAVRPWWPAAPHVDMDLNRAISNRSG